MHTQTHTRSGWTNAGEASSCPGPTEGDGAEGTRPELPHPHPQPGTHDSDSGADGNKTRGISPLNAPSLITQLSFTSQRHGRWQSSRGHFHGGRGGGEPVWRDPPGRALAAAWRGSGAGLELGICERSPRSVGRESGSRARQRRVVPSCPALTSARRAGQHRARTARALHNIFLFATILLLLLQNPPGAPAAQRSPARPSRRCSVVVCIKTAAMGLPKCHHSPRSRDCPQGHHGSLGTRTAGRPGHRGPCKPGDGLQVNAWRVTKSLAKAAPKADSGQSHPVIPNLMPPWTWQCQVPVLPLQCLIPSFINLQHILHRRELK